MNTVNRMNGWISRPLALAVVVIVVVGCGPSGLAPADEDPLKDTETVSESAVTGFPQLTWDVDAGAQAYANMIGALRNAALSRTRARRTQISVDRRNVAVDITDNTATNSFVDVVVRSGDTAVHLLIRLSDFYMVGFYFVERGTTYYYPIASINNAPSMPGAEVLSYWAGAENYNYLSNQAGIGMTSMQVSHANIRQAIFDMRDTTGSQTPTNIMARGILRMIIAVAEGSRFRPLAADIGNALSHNSAVTLGNRYVELVRDWQDLSHTYIDHANNPNTSTASTSTANWGLINSAQAAARLLMVCLNSGSNPNPHDEL